jgi:hypothetical protein
MINIIIILLPDVIISLRKVANNKPKKVKNKNNKKLKELIAISDCKTRPIESTENSRNTTNNTNIRLLIRNTDPIKNPTAIELL